MQNYIIFTINLIITKLFFQFNIIRKIFTVMIFQKVIFIYIFQSLSTSPAPAPVLWDSAVEGTRHLLKNE